MHARLYLALAAAIACAGCYRTAPATDEPDPRVLELEKRVTRLEEATENLDRLATRMAELAEALSQLSTLGEKVSSSAPRATSSSDEELDDDTRLRLAEIDDKLAEIERKLSTGGGAGAGVRPPSRAARPPGPDPSVVYSVPVAGSPSEGPRYAKVTLVKAFEFACPFCYRVRGTLDQLRQIYGNNLRIVYKNLIVHPQSATIPAHAACAAHRQGKWTEMKTLIWDKGYNAGRDLSQANMDKLAGELGLDMARFHADMNGPCPQIVRDDAALLGKLGARGTPSFFINGRFLSGARPIDQFKTVIDEELAKANKRLRKKGAKLSRYYDEWVVAKGKPSL